MDFMVPVFWLTASQLLANHLVLYSFTRLLCQLIETFMDKAFHDDENNTALHTSKGRKPPHPALSPTGGEGSKY